MGVSNIQKALKTFTDLLLKMYTSYLLFTVLPVKYLNKSNFEQFIWLFWSSRLAIANKYIHTNIQI